MFSNRLNRWHCLLWVIVLALLIAGCGSEPIQVGFAGELTGRQSDLGLHGRNGVQLAVSNINEEGGINGRSLELIIVDDTGTEEGAIAAAKQLIAANPVAIIGHMTSGQTVASYPLTEEAGIILLSPAATTPELSMRDDYFFRVAPTNQFQAEIFANYLYHEAGLRSLAGIYDEDNAAYSRSYWEDVVAKFTDLGGTTTETVVFSADMEPNFAPLVADLQTGSPDGLFIIASPVDTALIAQQVHLQNWGVALFTAAWAQTDTLLQNGGTAVEGMNVVIGFDVNSQNPAYQTFAQQYEERFGYAPTFAAGEAYEAMLVLAKALRATNGSAENLKEIMLQTEEFPGLIGSISFDDYGDVRRPLFLLTVENGQFVTKTALTPEN